MNKLNIFFFLILFLPACNNPEDARPVDINPPVSGDYQQGIYILNEGNFDWGVASLSFLHTETQEIDNLIFRDTNGFELGNVAQSMSIHGDKGYIVVNNSEKVEIINPYTAEWIGRIRIPGGSPRYMEKISDNKAYLTELYAGCFWVLDLENEVVDKKVDVSGGWTESMVRLGDFVYMTKQREVRDPEQADQEILKIDIQSDKIVDRVTMPPGPSGLVLDKNEKIWVLCNGGLIQKEPTLLQLEPENMTIIQRFAFDNQAATYPGNLRINPAGDMLYFINGGIYAFEITASQLPQKPIIDAAKDQIYFALDIDPENGDIYLSDAIDYLQRGLIYQYSAEGSLLLEDKAEVMPNQFIFWRP
ncbi:YncE family protein [Persicobacter diffluens]|uniref:YncE family protein n=1 Tax=Persicobacter diffluens TaxID=981 RepID=A0AAN4W3Y2_9BACT|nr:hypothetical protein PEDI_41120 [Persicobacter diffluens]